MCMSYVHDFMCGGGPARRDLTDGGSSACRRRERTTHLSEPSLSPAAQAERESEPRERPLSHTIGSVVAGMAAKGAGGLVQADDMPELLRLEQELR